MKLLLHACCGPCSLEPVRLLREAGHDITISFCNSNIQPQAEYDKRLATLLAWARTEGIPVIEGAYDVQEWRDQISAAWSNGDAREQRCRTCYRGRLEAAAAYAAAQGFEGLGTTLAISPYQFSDVCAEELRAAADRHGLIAVWDDYRPLYPEATRRSRDLGMYRQNYCGCLFSKAEAEAERAERKARREQEKAVRAAADAERAAAEAEQRAAAREQQRAWQEKQRRKKAARKAYKAAHSD